MFQSFLSHPVKNNEDNGLVQIECPIWFLYYSCPYIILSSDLYSLFGFVLAFVVVVIVVVAVRIVLFYEPSRKFIAYWYVQCCLYTYSSYASVDHNMYR